MSTASTALATRCSFCRGLGQRVQNSATAPPQPMLPIEAACLKSLPIEIGLVDGELTPRAK